MQTANNFIKAIETHTNGLTAISSGNIGDCEECRTIHGMQDSPKDNFQLQIDNGNFPNEGSFSHTGCETCGSALGGNRYIAHGLDSEGELVHLSICVDCLMYFANGDVPDTWE